MVSSYVKDTISLDSTSRTYTDEGFLRVPGFVARSGIQQYMARELGLSGDQNRTVNVFRPESEVFSKDSLSTFKSSDLTFNHPSSEMVNTSNYKNVSIGVVESEGVKHGNFVKCDLLFKDGKAIKKIESGKSELSVGYSADFDESPGITDDGTKYEFIQRGIKVNHVALVDRARAGKSARIFDKKGVKNMPKVILDSGRSIDLDDENTAALVSDCISGLKKQFSDSSAELESAKIEIEKGAATNDALTEELNKVKAQFSDENVAKIVQNVVDTKALASNLVGEKFNCDSMDLTEIKRSAMSELRKTVDWKEKSSTYVDAAFDLAIEMKKENEKTNNDSLKKFGDDIAESHTPLNISDARSKRESNLNNAWSNK